MEIDARELRAVASRMAKIATREGAHSMISIRAGGGVASLSASDGDIEVRERVKASEGAPVECAVKARDLASVLGKISGASLFLSESQTDAPHLRIESNGSRVDLPSTPLDCVPSLVHPFDSEDADVTELWFEPEGLRESAAAVMHAISHDESRYALNGAHLRVRDGVASLEATDGHRLARANVCDGMEDAGDLSAILPPKAMEAIQWFAGYSVEIEIALCAVRITGGDDDPVVIARTVGATYPNTDAVVPEEEGMASVDVCSAEARSWVALAATCASKELSAVDVEIDRGAGEVVVSSVDGGLDSSGSVVVREPLSDAVRGQDCRVRLAHKYLSDAIAATSPGTGMVRIVLRGGGAPVSVLPLDASGEPVPGVVCIVMPMRG